LLLLQANTEDARKNTVFCLIWYDLKKPKTTPEVQYFLNIQFAANTHRHVSRVNLY